MNAAALAVSNIISGIVEIDGLVARDTGSAFQSQGGVLAVGDSATQVGFSSIYSNAIQVEVAAVQNHAAKGGLSGSSLGT